jgi:hypothetical protein
MAMKHDQPKRSARKPLALASKKKAATGNRTRAAVAVAVIEPSKKDKLVRDSFTLPREDFELIALLKDRALDFKRPTKKSELLRAGLQALAGLDQTRLRASLEALRPLKAGRPKNKA